MSIESREDLLHPLLQPTPKEKRKKPGKFRNNILTRYYHVNPQAPVAQKVADELVFRCFQGEGVEFFQIGPH